MSGFVSKISAAGSKGWTGLQSLWERDNKTPLNNASDSGPPPEKTSLLNLALPSRHPKGSRLLSEDEDCIDSPPEDNTTDSSTNITTTTAATSPSISTTSSSQALPKINTPTPANCSPRNQIKAEKTTTPSTTTEWSTFSEDDADVWLKEDSAHRGILDTDKKKSTRESKRPSPRFKHKMTGASSPKATDRKHGDRGGEKGFSPLGKLKGSTFGKLLDSEERESGDAGGGVSFTNAGCDNNMWADDEDDEAQWKMIEQRATPQSK